jgi:hypothetical protein
MKRWEGEVFQNNHLQLMRCHLGCGIFWALMGGVFFRLSPEWLVALFLLLTLGHFYLAWASWEKSSTARRVSEFLFAAYIMLFPIGTLLAFLVFLPAADWKAPVPADQKDSPEDDRQMPG